MNANPPPQFGRIALRGGLVTIGAQGFKMAIQFLSVIVLARLLVPEDFGLVASVGPIVAIVALLQNLGLQQAVVQRKEISDRQLNQVFWISAVVGLGSAVVVTCLAPAIAAFYGDQRMLGITIASALPLLLGSMAAVPLALLNRHLRFGQLALNDMMTAAAGLLTTAVAAYVGLGYWSLVIGPAVSAVIALVAAWLATQWMPSRPELKVDAEILSFGANLTGFNVANFFARNLDKILIGKISGAVELGYYDRAYKLLLFPLQNINQPLTRVMVPLLSRIHEDKARFRDIYVRTNWMLAAVIVPGIAALTCTSRQTVDLLFGDHWGDVAPIFAWLGIASLVQPVSNTTGWIFICQAKTKIMFYWGVCSSLVTVVSFIVGIHWGAVGLAAAYAIQSYVFNLPALTVLVKRVGPVTATDFLLLQGLPLASALIAWGLYLQLAALLIGPSDLSAILLAIGVNYAVALMLMSVVPQARRALSSTLSNSLRNIR
jgi:O-antigen/teichoic acid export membrane protein